MAQQLIYTSAARLLDAGRSGFGTVARSKSLSPLLVSTIERVSQFANIRGTDRSRVILVHRRIVAANNRIQLLSRISDAGADYTGRTNHIAHHLIVTQEEMARLAARGITPADVLMQFTWLTRWDAAPKFFGPEDEVSLERTIQPGGKNSARSSWSRITGNPSHARLLAWDGTPRSGVLIIPAGQDPLWILAEALAEFAGTQCWSRTFTTHLEGTDEMADFDWVLCTPDTFRDIESRCGNRTCLDLSQPGTLPLPPEPVTPTRPFESQTIPNSASPTGPAVHQPASSPARINVKTVTDQKPQAVTPITPKSSHYTTAFTIAAAAAALLIAGLILWKVAIPKKPEGVIVTGNQFTENDRNAAKEILRNAGVSADKSEQFVELCKGDPKKWANYASALLDKFNNPPALHELRSGIGDKPEGQMSSDWLDQLDQAKIALAEYDRIDQDDSKIPQRLEKLAKIHSSLSEASNILSELPLSKGSVEKFYGPLVIKELEKIFGTGDWNYLSDEKIKLIIRNLQNHFGKSDKPHSYAILCKFIRKNFENFVSSSLAKQYAESAGATADEQDIKNFKLALALWNKPNQANENQLEGSYGEGFIPEDFDKKLIKNRLTSTRSIKDSSPLQANTAEIKENEPEKLDFSDVPVNEIIVLSTEDLANGVAVKLLNKIFEPHFARALNNSTYTQNQNTKIKLDSLNIQIIPQDEKSQSTELYLSDDKNSFGRSLTNSELVFKKDTIFYTKTDVSSIRFTLSQNGTEWQSLLLIDQDNFRDFISKTFFTLEAVDSDQGKLDGDFIKQMNQVKNAKGESIRNNLKLKSTPAQKIVKSGDFYLIKREKQKKPEIILSERDKNTIKQRLDDCKTKESGTKKDNYNAACTNFFEAIRDAIRGSILAKELELQDESFINQSTHEEAARNLYQKAGGNSSGFPTWDVELKEIKTKVGDEKLNETLEKLGIKGFSDMPKDSKKYKLSDLYQTMDTLFKNSMAPAERKSLYEELENLNSLQILSPKDRVIFEATRKR